MAKAAKKKAAKKKAATPKKPKFGSNVSIVASSLPDENPRNEGTSAHGKFEAMRKYVKKNPSATVADVIANTDYKRNDYEWDLERKAFKTKSAKGAAAAPTPPAG